MKTEINGVDIIQMNETIEMIKDNPKLARFQFKANSKWVTGGNAKVEIHKFYSAGQEDKSRAAPFIIQTDEPAVLLGTNKHPNPVEYVLASLVSCLTVGYSYTAAMWGIKIEKLEFDIEGSLNLCGFLGLDENIRAGYDDITIHTTIEADAPAQKLNELQEYVQRTSPVLDIIRNPVNVVFSNDSKKVSSNENI